MSHRFRSLVVTCAVCVSLAGLAAPAAAQVRRPTVRGSIGVARSRPVPIFRGFRPVVSRPYFPLIPRGTFGFGLSIFGGYPFAYRYSAYPYGAYPYPYSYPYAAYPTYGYYPASAPYADGYAAAGYSVDASQYSGNTLSQYGASAMTGRVTLEVTPADAAVFIDGNYVGLARDFAAATPLGLTSGRHRLELRAQGYQTISADLDVTVGRTTPYRTTMNVIR